MMRWQMQFTAEGLNLERLIRKAAGEELELTRVRRQGARKLTACIREKDLSALKTMAEQGGWVIVPGRRMGIGRLMDIAARRWMLFLAMLIAVLLIIAAMQVCWQVEITDAGSYAAELRTALAEYGVKAPMLRRSVDPAALRDWLEWRFPRIAWIECGWRGMSLCIRVVEGVFSGDNEKASGACDIVASRDGIVTGIVTRAGTPVVKIGDLVRKGQVLIRGEERTKEGAVRPVSARGSVTARIWRNAQVMTPLYETLTTETGRQQTVRTVSSPWFDLWRMPESGFVHEDVSICEMPLGGLFLPLTIRTETRLESELSPSRRELDEVIDEGGDAATGKLLQMSGDEESLVDNWVNWSIIEDEILLSVATGEWLADIARQERSSVMAAAE